jgi:putative transposase
LRELAPQKIEAWRVDYNEYRPHQSLNDRTPQHNAYIERFNRTVRHEWLDEHPFESIQHAQQTATEWLWRYNIERSNMAPGGMTPYQKMANAA